MGHKIVCIFYGLFFLVVSLFGSETHTEWLISLMAATYFVEKLWEKE